MMQYEMAFRSPDRSAAVPALPQLDDAPPGILTGRPWRRAAPLAGEILSGLRRRLPVDFAVSDNLLAILAGRGFADAATLEQFFYPSLSQLPDPLLLPEMEAAVTRLLAAIAQGETMAVHGDFDVDGITGAALLAELLDVATADGRRARLQPVFIPDRAQDGYGVAERMIRHWAGERVTLLLTIDTGASATAEMELARRLGLDVLVLDHHIFQERPPVTAMVNPQHPDSRYPHRDLCGVAVAFKLTQALCRMAPEVVPPSFPETVLDLVTLGVIADQMPLVGENRVLVKKGLERLGRRLHARPGLDALLAVAGLDQGLPPSASDLAYQVIPRLNACGRIGRVMTALELLLCRDVGVARDLAREADRTNLLRRQADQALKAEAVEMAGPFLDQGDRGLVLHSPDWHKGIIGIGASRLVEKYQVPTVLIATDGEQARGSARSTSNIDVKTVLDHCAHTLIRYGGHAQAAGLSLRTQDIETFRQAFLAALEAGPATGPSPEPYDLDLPLARLTAGDVSQLFGELELLEPFGMGNQRPVFRSCGLRLLRWPQPLSGGLHLRFAFSGPDESPSQGSPALLREFICFGGGPAWQDWLATTGAGAQDPRARRWDLLFQLNRSTYRLHGDQYDPVQQLLVDLRPAQS